VAYNFSRNMVGGDIGGLRGLAATLNLYPPQMQAVVDALNRQVGSLVNDAGWWGDAADRFKRQWEGDSIGAQVLKEVVVAVTGIVATLATNLRVVESALEQAADDARASGVPVAPTGELLALPPDAAPNVIQAATIYSDTRNYAMEVAGRARFEATAQLQSVEAVIGPPPNAGMGAVAPPDTWVTVGDTIAGLYAVPASASKYLRTQLPTLKANRDLAHAKFSAAQKQYSKLGLKMPDDIKAERRSALQALEKANEDLTRIERWDTKLAKLMDVRAGEVIPGLRAAADGSRLARFGADIPVIDIAAVGIATGLSSRDDMQKGDDASAIPKELSANVVALAAGAVVATVVVGAAVAVGAPVILAVGAGVVIGGAVAVGVGDAVSNVWHEHWDEDIHQYGVAGGIGHGLEDVAGKTGQDMANLGSTIKNGVAGAATSLWHGIFG
jgi:uncharacterized protein YukE